MNQLMLAMAMNGGGVSPGTLKAIQSMRLRNYEKLCLFIKWLVTTLVYGYYWLKKHPDVFMQDGKTQDYTGEGTQALLNAFWSRQDQKDFIANMIREGGDLLMAWLKPDEHEMDMWSMMLQNPSPAAQLPALLGNQQATLQTLLSRLQSLPLTTYPTVGQLPPLPAGMTPDQYRQIYGAAPPVAAAPMVSASAPPPAVRSRLGGL